MLRNDIQKLEPGSLVTLIEVDCTEFNGDILYFHGHNVSYSQKALEGIFNPLYAGSLTWEAGNLDRYAGEGATEVFALPIISGGSGLSSSISGSTITRAVGGNGGGGAAATPGSPGTTNSGIGGGGGGGGAAGGNGGSGVFIITYRGIPKATGGVITQANGYTIHTFNSSGDLVIN